MATKIRGITIELSADASGVLNALNSIKNVTKSTSNELKDVSKLLKLDPTNTTLLTQKTKLLQEQIANTQTKLQTLKETQQNMKDNGVDENSEQYRALQREIEATNIQLKELKKTTGSGSAVLAEISATTGKWGNKLETAGQKMAGVTVALGTGFVGAAKTAIDFETAFTGVKKTVDGTDDQLESIKQGILDLSKNTASSAVEIAGVAEAAGQLGIATDDVIDFTKVMVMLGDTTNLSAEDAASNLAKFANITGTSSDDYERLGSTIVDLGNNFATTERDIVEMATRMASAGKIAGLSEPEIFALATAMSSVGIEAQAGGTAMSQTMKNIEEMVVGGGEDLEKIAAIAGTTASDFAESWKNDPITAITSFISGLGDLDEKGESATLVLDELGMSGIRQSNMLKALSLASGMMTEAVGTANTAWQQNTALSDEASKKYETTEAKISQLKATLAEAGIQVGEILLPIIKDGIEWLKKVITGFSNLDSGTKKTIVTIAGMVAAISPLLIAGGKILKGISSITGALSKMGGSSFGTIGLVVAGVGALYAGVNALADSWLNAYNENSLFYQALQKTKTANDDLSKSIEGAKTAYSGTVEASEAQAAAASVLWEKLQSLLDVEDKTAGQQAEIKSIVGELNELIPGLGLSYDEVTGAINKTNEEIKSNIELMKLQAQQEAAQEFYTEALKNQYKAQQNYNQAVRDLAGVLYETGISTDDYMRVIADGIITADEGVEMWTKYGFSLDQLQGIFEEVTTATGNLGDASKNLQDANADLAYSEQQLSTVYEESSEKIAQAAENAAQATDQTEITAENGTATGEAWVDGMETALEGSSEVIADATQTAVESADASAEMYEVGYEGGESLGEGYSDSAPEVAEGAGQLATTATDAVADVPDEMNTTGTDATDELNQGIKDRMDFVQATLAKMAGLFNSEMADVGDVLYKQGNIALSKLADAISDGANNKVIPGMQSTVNGMQSAISSLPSLMYSAGYDAGAGLYNGLSAWSASLYNQAWSIANSINAAARSALRIHSPSRVMMEVGKFVDEGLVEGMAANANKVTDEARTVADGITTTMQSMDTDYNAGLKAVNANIAASSVSSRMAADNNASQTGAILSLMQRFLPYLAEAQDIQFDDGTWAGRLAPKINKEFGNMRLRSVRL